MTISQPLRQSDYMTKNAYDGITGLVSFCSRNEIPQSGYFISDRNVLLKVLEAPKSKSKATASLVSPQELAFLFQYEAFCYSLTWQTGWEASGLGHTPTSLL